MVATWNPVYRKLTTSDQKGLIIVWMMHKGAWFEEMINNRNKSVVRDMRWRSNGQEICIAYEDGVVIVGGVDGNRLWSKDMGGTLTLMEWAPDGKILLFVINSTDLIIHNHQGVRLGNIPIHPNIYNSQAPVRITGIEWYDGTDGHTYPNAPVLAVAFENGRIQIMRHIEDDAPVLIDTRLQLNNIKWNINGTLLAVTGVPIDNNNSNNNAEVQFYTCLGKYTTTLRVPGGAISSITWEGSGLRLALAVDSFIYFANIRPPYRWCSFGDTVVYSFAKPGREEQCVIFWNTKTNEKYTKYVRNLLEMQGSGEHCVLISLADEENSTTTEPGSSSSTTPNPASTTKSTGRQYVVILCNAIGSPVDSKHISVYPDHVTMTPFHVAIASTDTLYVWHYRTQVSRLTSIDSNTLRRKEGRERIFQLEDQTVTGNGDFINNNNNSNNNNGGSICALCTSTKYLLVARENGIVYQYQLPSLILENKFRLRCRPVRMQINCDSTRFSVIDLSNVLTFFDMEAKSIGPGGTTVIGEHLSFERRDVWDMAWADDYPDLWCATEKARMYVFRNFEPEEPTLSSGYIRRFSDLTISTVLLDEIYEHPDTPSKENHVIEHEIRSLRDMRTLLATNSLRDCLAFVEENSHPRLWRLLAETALTKLDLPMAEKSFVAAGDYPGIQFVKRLQLLRDKSIQKAEVSAYFQRFQEAEDIYHQMDRKDLAIELRMRIGDWKNVLSLIENVTGEDELLHIAYTRLGDYYADRQQYNQAIPFYERAKANDMLVECYYVVERYSAIVDLIDVLPEGNALLQNIGKKLQSIGLSEAAARAFVKANDIKAAVDCCVLSNHWDTAVDLAQQYSLPQVEGLMAKYVSRLLDQNKTLTAIELYRKANRDIESAKLLANLGNDIAKTKINPLRAKQFFVLAAIEVERHRRRTMDLSSLNTVNTVNGTVATGGEKTGGGATKSNNKTAMTMGGGRTNATMMTAVTLDTLMREDAESQRSVDVGGRARTLDSAWHGAEAFHFWMLAQRQLYAGQIQDAMITAQRLTQYEDILDPKDIYSLIALTSYYSQYYNIASRALIRLEHLDTLNSVQQEKYTDVAYAMFTRNRPVDIPNQDVRQCPTNGCNGTIGRHQTNCTVCKSNYPVCVITGQVILVPVTGSSPTLGSMTTRTYLCSTCRHRALIEKMKGRNSCALCHAPVEINNSNK